MSGGAVALPRHPFGGLPTDARMRLGLHDVANLARVMDALEARGETPKPGPALSFALAVAASVIAAGEDGPHRPRSLVAPDPKPPGPPPDPARVMAFLASAPNANPARAKGRRRAR